MRCFPLFFSCLVVFISLSFAVSAEEDGWYTESNFAPLTRVSIELVNTLDFDRTDCPVVITRDRFPIKDLHEMWVTVVDPSLPSDPVPSKESIAFGGGHMTREETNGHQIFRQLDDLDRDGVWDELFFQTDIKANETKEMYVYIGFSQRGWNEHGTQALIGSYCRHQIPFWESAHIGWKLWFPTDCDMYGKRTGVLMAHVLCSQNACGYNGIPKINFDYGSDIMTVSDSFGAGGICLFEQPAYPDSVSRPRFTPHEGTKMSPGTWNEGQINDTRYVFEVVSNGPMRSIIRVRTLNWNTGAGFYELEQLYTAYTNQNYSTCRVRYLTFFPEKSGTMFGCGIRKNRREFDHYREGGVVITIGDDEINDPDDDTGQKSLHVDYVGTALVVKDCYDPQYRFIQARGGNHAFTIPVREDLSYEYLIAGAWSEGSILKTPDEFKAYVITTAREYNNPIEIKNMRIQTK